MTDESRKAFEAAMMGWGWEACEFVMDESGLFYSSDDARMAYRGWRCRDTEVAAATTLIGDLRGVVKDSIVERAALKARVTFLEGTVKSILDHINRGNAPERYAGMTDFGISQDRGMTISSIKRLAEESLR